MVCSAISCWKPQICSHEIALLGNNNHQNCLFAYVPFSPGETLGKSRKPYLSEPSRVGMHETCAQLLLRAPSLTRPVRSHTHPRLTLQPHLPF